MPKKTLSSAFRTGLWQSFVIRRFRTVPCYVRLDPIVGSLDTVSDRPPVDVFKQCDSCLGHPADHPGNFIIEVFCKAALAICPGNAFSQYTVFGAFDPLGPVADVNRNAIEIRGTP